MGQRIRGRTQSQHRLLQSRLCPRCCRDGESRTEYEHEPVLHHACRQQDDAEELHDLWQSCERDGSLRPDRGGGVTPGFNPSDGHPINDYVMKSVSIIKMPDGQPHVKIEVVERVPGSKAAQGK